MFPTNFSDIELIQKVIDEPLSLILRKRGEEDGINEKIGKE